MSHFSYFRGQILNLSPVVGEFPYMMNEVCIKTGDLAVVKGDDILITCGVGSCVVACFWDAKNGIGGMAHMLVPSSGSCEPDPLNSPGLSPDTALPMLLYLMERRGAIRKNMNVRLIGAGNMFEMIEKGFMTHIGQEILHSAEKVITSLGLIVTDQSVGGQYGRTVRFNVRTGIIEIDLTNGNRVCL